MAHREPFDIKRPLVAATDFTFAGDKYQKGDPFPRSAPAQSFNASLIRRQYDAHKVNHVAPEPEADASQDPVQMRQTSKKHTYAVSAPWLAEPETIRGVANAEKRVAELRAEGPPLGWIEGGSSVELEGGDGGWYTVTAPWLETPERIQGREAAETRQRELHEAGAPEPEDDQSGGPGAPGAEDDESGSGENAAKSESGEDGKEGAAEEGGPTEPAAEEGADEAGERKGAETIPGTGPALAAGDVEAAAGDPPAAD